MFDLPEAKRVCREEITAISRSPSYSRVVEDEDGHARLGRLLDLDIIHSAKNFRDTPNSTPPGLEHESVPSNEEQEQEFEFRLFGTTVKPEVSNAVDGQTNASERQGKQSVSDDRSNIQKLRLRLRSPTPVPTNPGEGGFIKPFRGWQHYFTTPQLLSSHRVHGDAPNPLRREYADMAISGPQIMERAKRDVWPGCRMSWRVIHVNRSNKIQKANLSQPDQGSDLCSQIVDLSAQSQSTHVVSKSRKRPGKKRRVILRKRTTAAAVAKITDAEKRNKKNRENKIRRRQKKRDQKAVLTETRLPSD